MKKLSNTEAELKKALLIKKVCTVFNPSRPSPGRREKINLNFYFQNFCGTSKGFMKALKGCVQYIFVSLFCMSKREHL